MPRPRPVAASVRAAALLFAALYTSLISSAAVDLAQRFPATIDYSKSMTPFEWACSPGDAWALRSFTCRLNEDVSLELGAATVVIGHYERNAVWAAVFPHESGTLVSAAHGEETVRSVWLRFNPARIGELFRAETVIGPGDAAVEARARRLCAWKLAGSWHAGPLVVIPPRKALVLDVDTTDGVRRFFGVEADGSSVRYQAAFEARALPATVPIDRNAALAAFDAAWSAFDREYAMFGIRPHVDWKALRATHRPRAAEATTTYDVGASLAAMIGALDDGHAQVRVGIERVPIRQRMRPVNGNPQAASRLVGRLTDLQTGIAWGRTDDGIGYVMSYSLGNPRAVQSFDAALEKLADTWGLILDLRFNGGGDETIGRQIAGRFLDRRQVYASSRVRNGPGHDDLGPLMERRAAPRGPWRYAAPLVVLIGQQTVSSAEGFALMLARVPAVRLVGDRTAGSSGNPRNVDVGAGIVVSIPRWIALRPDGVPVETNGVVPDVAVQTSPEQFSPRSDPVLKAALEMLRETPAAQRRHGRAAPGGAP